MQVSEIEAEDISDYKKVSFYCQHKLVGCLNNIINIAINFYCFFLLKVNQHT